MRSVIRLLKGSLQDLLRDRPIGSPGNELAFFIPPGVEWKQLNYGQGEGQAEVGSCEWGFYYTSDCGVAVQLEVGEFPATDAYEFVRRVAEKLCRGEEFEIVIQGTVEP